MRRRPLKRDEEAAREWLRRSRENAQLSKPRQPLRRATGLSRGRTLARKVSSSARPDAEGPLTPAAWRAAVLILDKHQCVGCGRRLLYESTWEAHHAIPKQRLRRERLLMHVWDVRNGIALCRPCHERHESAAARVPYGSLPPRVRAFARELGDWAVDVLVRMHPPAAAGGHDEEET